MSRNWSPQQLAIFAWFAATGAARNLVVRARAGTGKSTTAVEAINRAQWAGRILMAAFAKRNATDLQAKVNNPRADVKTLHALGYGYIRRVWENTQLDNNRGRKLAQEVCGIDAPDTVIGQVAKLAAMAKNMLPFATQEEELMDIQEEFELGLDDEWVEQGFDDQYVRIKAIEAKEQARHNTGAIDFDDMLFVPVANGFITASYDLVVIDEAQDMGYTQLVMAQRACKKTGRIVVIGDDRQAMYGFRGADSGSIDRLKKELNAEELPLTITYRCPKKVVGLAAELVPDYQAAPSAPEGEILSVEKEKLVDTLFPGDLVLSRKNAPLASLCLRALRSGKKACVAGRDIGAGLVALIKRLGKAKNMPHLMEKLAKWEDREVAKWQAAKKENKVVEVQDRAETIRELADGLTSVKELENRINSLFTDNGDNTPKIMFSTVHRAKGGEAQRVFVLRSTLYPYKGADQKIEEVNIHYVALTRSMQTLVLVEGKF